MTTSAGGRWMCGQCRANNFDTVTSCWKCGTARSNASPITTPPLRTGERMAAAAMPASYAPSLEGDPAVAKRAALLLALTIPFLGLPVGWIFMMMEDYRRQAIGRFCVLWSCIGLLIHFFLGIFMVQALADVATRYVFPMAQQLKNMKNSNGGGQNIDLPSGLGGSN